MDKKDKLLYKEVALCNFYLSAVEDKLMYLEDDESGNLVAAFKLIRALRDAINKVMHFNCKFDNKEISESL